MNLTDFDVNLEIVGLPDKDIDNLYIELRSMIKKDLPLVRASDIRIYRSLRMS